MILLALHFYVFVGTSVIVTHRLLTRNFYTHHSELTCGLGFSPHLPSLPALFYIEPINWRICGNIFLRAQGITCISLLPYSIIEAHYLKTSSIVVWGIICRKKYLSTSLSIHQDVFSFNLSTFCRHTNRSCHHSRDLLGQQQILTSKMPHPPVQNLKVLYILI